VLDIINFYLVTHSWYNIPVHGWLANSPRGHFYSIFKQEFCMEPYLTRLIEVHRKFITKLRVNNIKFPIETGRWRNINREDRICQKCSYSLIGDEFHYSFVCNFHDILELRNKYIPNYFTTNASFYINTVVYSNKS
jgi:hypothetical protein